MPVLLPTVKHDPAAQGPAVAELGVKALAMAMKTSSLQSVLNQLLLPLMLQFATDPQVLNMLGLLAMVLDKSEGKRPNRVFAESL